MKRLFMWATLLGSLSLSTGIAGTQQSASEAQERMKGVAGIFAKNGLNAFNILNGISQGESGGEINSKGSGTDNIENTAILKSSDPHAELFCVKNDMWVVKQSRPLEVNTTANNWTDATGKPMLPSIITSLRQSPNGVATVEYTTKVEGVKDPKTGKDFQEKRFIIAYSSKALLGKSTNDTGAKFFCGTTFAAS